MYARYKTQWEVVKSRRSARVDGGRPLQELPVFLQGLGCWLYVAAEVAVDRISRRKPRLVGEDKAGNDFGWDAAVGRRGGGGCPSCRALALAGVVTNDLVGLLISQFASLDVFTNNCRVLH